MSQAARRLLFLMCSLAVLYLPVSVANQSMDKQAAQTGSAEKPLTQHDEGAVDTNVTDNFTSFLKDNGVIYSLIGNDVAISAMGNKVIEIIPFLQSNGMMLNNITKSDTEIHPITLAGGATIALTLLTVVEIYSTTTSDKLHFDVYLTEPDDYGNDQNNLMVSFDFNRTLFDKINWDEITMQGFMKITPNFQFSNWYLNALNLGK